MTRFPMIVFAFGLPLLGFLVLNDGVSTLYQNLGPKSGPLAYVVAEPEEEEIEEAPEEAPVAEESAAVETEVEPEVEPAAEEVVVEAEGAAVGEDAPADVAAAPEAEAETIEVAAIDLAAASRLMRRCTACHQLERERNGVGPHLLGVIGREIGAVEGYRYSEALTGLNAEGQVWSEDALVAWLEDPAEFAPGTKMNFKVREEEDRRLIAAWLAQNSQ